MSKRSPGARLASGLRVVLLLGAGLLLMEPYLDRGTVGASDAHSYVSFTGDFILQVRAGVFPVWVGQTPFGFYGGIFPLRVAPYLQHFAAFIDLITGRRLPVFTVVNLTVAASLVAGLVSCYFCLAQVMPRRPWNAALLALLYASCPGVLGLAYAQDLYASFMTLPFLPVVFLGMIRSFERNDAISRLLMAGGLAAAWLAHPPIALWCGAIAVVTQIVRLGQLGWDRRSRQLDLLAVGVFAILAGYPFVSAAALKLGVQHVRLENFFFQIRQAFPGNWLPLHRAVPLENLQLGYGLAGLLLIFAVVAAVSRDRLAQTLFASGLLLLALLLPLPVLNSGLWHLVPQRVLDLTNFWPMQRLFVQLALCIVFGISVLGRKAFETPLASALVTLVLLLAVGWSGFQARQLIIFARGTAPSAADSARMLRSENLTVPNIWVALSIGSSAPRYASGGVMDPVLEHRFLDRTSRALRLSMVDAVAPGFGPGAKKDAGPELPGIFTGELDANPGILNLRPRLTLNPRQHYLLLLQFLDHPYAGTLIIEGREFYRQYALPRSGEPEAFGSGPEASHAIPLWTSLDYPEDVQLRFVPDDSSPLRYSPFAHFELRSYTPGQLPVQVESWVPYRARVHSAERGFLATPRLMIPGYRASVDGERVTLETSPDGCVLVPIEPGPHLVEVSYQPPLVVRLAYWATALGWLAYFALLAGLVGRSKTAPPAGNPGLV